MIRIQLLRSLPHHQHHPARPIPTLRLIGQLMEPEPRRLLSGIAPPVGSSRASPSGSGPHSCGFERYRARLSTPAPPAAPAPGTPHSIRTIIEPHRRPRQRSTTPERQLQRLLPQVAGPRINLPVDQVPRLGTTRHQPHGPSAGDSIRSIRFPGDAHGPRPGDRPRPGTIVFFRLFFRGVFSPRFRRRPSIISIRRHASSVTAWCRTGRFSSRLSVSSSRDKVGCDASPWPSSKAAVPRRVWLATRKLGS